MQKTANGIDGAIEFSQQQLPDIVQQLLMWKMTQSGAGLIIGIALVVVSALGAKEIVKSYKRREWAYESLMGLFGSGFASSMAAGAVFLTGVPMMCINGLTFCKFSLRQKCICWNTRAIWFDTNNKRARNERTIYNRRARAAP